LEDNNALQPLYSNLKKSESLPSSSSHKINSERFLLHDNSRLDKSVCITEVIKTYGQTVLPHSLYRPDLAPSDYHLFDPLKKIMHCRQLCASSCRKGRETFTRCEYMILFKGRRSVTKDREYVKKLLCLQLWGRRS
jgi:hypothetical protein